MPYSLLVPTRRQPFGHEPRTLWIRMGFDVAQTLLKESGSWRLAVSPTAERLAAAEAYYIGGYTYTISDEVAGDLVADGFEDAISPPYVAVVDYDSLILADSPLIYFRLDEADADIPQDSSGNGFHSVYTEGVLVAGLHTGSDGARSCEVGYAFDSYGYGSLGTTAGLSMEAWFDCSATYRLNFYAYSTSEDSNQGMDIDFKSGVGNDAYVLRGIDIAEINPLPSLSEGVHHVAYTWDNLVLKVYVDGVLTNSEPAAFAALDADEVYCLVNGAVDSFALYGSALTAEQILAHYEAGVA